MNSFKSVLGAHNTLLVWERGKGKKGGEGREEKVSDGQHQS